MAVEVRLELGMSRPGAMSLGDMSSICGPLVVGSGAYSPVWRDLMHLHGDEMDDCHAKAARYGKEGCSPCTVSQSVRMNAVALQNSTRFNEVVDRVQK